MMEELIYPEDIAPTVPPVSVSNRDTDIRGAEWFPVVEPSGLVTGRATRLYCHSGAKPLHPVVHLHVMDRFGRLYLQKRSLKKDIQPGKWDTAVGGHVDYGEGIIEALYREASEELGFSEFNPVHIVTYVFESDVEKELVNVFAAVGSFSLFPDKELRLYSYADEMRGLYKDTRKFRDSILIGGLVTLAILFIGLIGYTTDEVNRRRKEMAIRRINGATLADVLRLFLKDISRILLPATLLGAVAAYAVAGLWQEQFSEKVPLSWYLFVGGVLLVIAIVLGIASLNIHKAANDNPAENLKNE